MKVILLQDVPKVGHKYDVVDVADGYANNLLFPQKLAEKATPQRIAELARKREGAKAAEDARRADLAEKLTEIAEHTLTITAKADDQGHLYKKIHAADIMQALNDEHGVDLPKGAIELDEPLHEVGDHEVSVSAVDQTVTVRVQIVAE